MKAVIIGGTGLVGGQVSSILQHLGMAVVVASRTNGIDAISGAGVSEAVHDADVVVDASNTPGNDPGRALEFFTQTTTNLMKAEREADVRHHVVLSIVGADRVHQHGYFRAKAAQEALVENSGIPFSILRATQFFEFAHQIALWNTFEDTVRLPPRPIRPIASNDVAREIVRLVRSYPAGVTEIAGPQLIPLDEFVRRVLLKDHDDRYVFTDVAAEPLGFNLEAPLLLPEAHASIATTTLDSWLSRARSMSNSHPALYTFR